MGFNGQIFCNSVFNNILQVEQKTLEKEMGSLGLDMTNNDEVKLINSYYLKLNGLLQILIL